MIDMTETLVASVHDAMDAVNELHAAIDALPDEKTVVINYVQRMEGQGPSDVSTIARQVDVVTTTTGDQGAGDMAQTAAEVAAVRQQFEQMAQAEADGQAAAEAFGAELDDLTSRVRAARLSIGDVTQTAAQEAAEANRAALANYQWGKEMEALGQDMVAINEGLDAYGSDVSAVQALEERAALNRIGMAVANDRLAASYTDVDEAMIRANANVVTTAMADKNAADSVSQLQQMQERETEQLGEIAVAAAEAEAASKAMADSSLAGYNRAMQAADLLRLSTVNLDEEMAANSSLSQEAARSGDLLAEAWNNVRNAFEAVDEGSQLVESHLGAVDNLLRALATGGITAFNQALAENTIEEGEAARAMDALREDLNAYSQEQLNATAITAEAAAAIDRAKNENLLANEALAAAGVEWNRLGATAAAAAGNMDEAAARVAAMRAGIDALTTSSRASSEDIAALGAATLALAEAETRAGTSFGNFYTGAATTVASLAALVAAAKQAGAETGITGANMVAMGAAAKSAGDNIGGLTIPLGAAAFGITGIGTALHLVVMGVFEFLAVFIPAMYAAAAASMVLYQGIAEQVVPHLQGLYTAAEALGPMFNTTAGQMLGLGNSLQIAQNEANPMAYTLLGEAVLGLKEATGQTTGPMNQFGAGISQFGEIGLTVAQELERFGASIDVSLVQNMGKVQSVLASAVADLTEFGQIFGNLGHAILNFASAMPGAAEIALKLVDAFTKLLKWVSSLPSALITVIMVFEELYRWSGIVAGLFGVLGRAIALIGTLGIPVFAKIGQNVAMMAANVLTGVGDMVTTFVAGGERIGVFGAEVDKVATGIVGGLGEAASFLTGPWGIAVGLGAVAVGGLIIMLLRSKDATQQLIASMQQLVSTASNLNVLNQIAENMANTTQQIDINTQSLNKLSGAAHQAAGAGSELDGTNRVLQYQMQSTSQSINELTGYQKTLVTQSLNVVSGASAISKEFGVNFTSALGMADLAGVKLNNTTVEFGKNANQAGVQLESLYRGFAIMDQTGGTLTNTMAAINVEAGIQASKVQQVNQAWDQFIGMSTSLTGSYSQFELDLQQMGNTAQVTGAKINAFTGTTTMSVGQIAHSLTSFSGSSAQTWQAFDQSVTQANTFMDSLRTAAAAGVVSQGDFQTAIAHVVGELIPYASQNKAALAQVQALASEANGPASGSLGQLQSWVNKTGDSTSQFTGLIDTLTQKISNVTAVAKNFAGTLQSDVMNAVAAAGANTAQVTKETQAFTSSLQQNGAQAAQTKSAQDTLTNTLKQYGFNAQQIQQVEQILTNEYANNADQAGKTGQATDGLGGKLNNAKNNAVDPLNRDVNTLSTSMGRTFVNAAGQAGTAAGNTAHGGMTDLTNAANAVNQAAKTAEGTLSHWPTQEHTNFGVSGSGSITIGSGVNGVSGHVFLTAEGGVMPGYEPGHDTIHAMLSPGEGVLIPEAVRGLGGAPAINSLNKQFRSARHFAEGGVVNVGSITNFGPTAANGDATAENSTNDQVRAALQAEMSKVIAGVKAAQAAAEAAAKGGLVHPTGSGATVEALMTSMAASIGWTGAQLTALLEVESREAGFNMNAVNPSSGAYGLAQFIGGAGEYAQYGGNANTAAGQITGMFNYIRQRYGSPSAAWAHEQSYGWYDNGGWLEPGLNVALNTTGQREKVTSPTGEGPAEGGLAPIAVHIDGKKVFEAMTPYAYQKSSRNNGNANAGTYWTPGSRG